MSRETLDLLIQALIPIFITTSGGLLVALVKFVTDYLAQRTNSNQVKFYTDALNDTILDVVESLNQTTVNPIKDKTGKLTDEEKTLIFQESYKQVLNIMGRRSLAVLARVYDDLNALILAKLEATVGAVNDERKRKELATKTAAVLAAACEAPEVELEEE